MQMSHLNLATRCLATSLLALTGPMYMAMAAPEANKFQPLDELDGIIISQSGNAIGQPGGAILPIDRRLRLEKCHHTPIFRRINDRMAALTCETPHWRIRVPLVAPLSESAPTTATTDYGDSTRAENEPNTTAIKKGSRVEILVNDPNLRFTSSGTALESGSIGDVISVSAEPFNKDVKARVINFETVELIDDPTSEF